MLPGLELQLLHDQMGILRLIHAMLLIQKQPSLQGGA